MTIINTATMRRDPRDGTYYADIHLAHGRLVIGAYYGYRDKAKLLEDLRAHPVPLHIERKV